MSQYNGEAHGDGALQGVWRLEDVRLDPQAWDVEEGRPGLERLKRELKLVIAGDRFCLDRPRTFRVDPTKDPKQIDIDDVAVVRIGEGAPREEREPIRGLYAVEGGRLRLAVPRGLLLGRPDWDWGERPASLTTPGPFEVVLTFARDAGP